MSLKEETVDELSEAHKKGDHERSTNLLSVVLVRL